MYRLYQSVFYLYQVKYRPRSVRSSYERKSVDIGRSEVLQTPGGLWSHGYSLGA